MKTIYISLIPIQMFSEIGFPEFKIIYIYPDNEIILLGIIFLNDCSAKHIKENWVFEMGVCELSDPEWAVTHVSLPVSYAGSHFT